MKLLSVGAAGGSTFVSIAILAMIIATCAHAGEITDIVEDCGSTKARIDKVEFEGCDQDDDTSCPAALGTKVKGAFTFTATEDITQLDCNLVGHLAGIDAELPCPEMDGCKSLEDGKTCPIAKGTQLTYKVEMDIQPYFPEVVVTGDWQLSDKDGKLALCLTIPVSITRGSTTKTVPTTPMPTTPTPTTPMPTSATHPTTTRPKIQSIDALEFHTADCSQCGMTIFGSIMTEVCGDISCCLTPWDQGSFNEGGTDIMTGQKIGECSNFAFKTANSPASQIRVTVFHQGTDALELSAVRIRTRDGSVYSCRMPQRYIDNSEYAKSEACLKLY